MRLVVVSGFASNFSFPVATSPRGIHWSILEHARISECNYSAGPDLNLRKDSPRYIQNCSADMAKHSTVRSDTDLYDTTFDFDTDPLAQPGQISFTNAPFGSQNTWRNQRAALTLGHLQL